MVGNRLTADCVFVHVRRGSHTSVETQTNKLPFKATKRERERAAGGERERESNR